MEGECSTQVILGGSGVSPIVRVRHPDQDASMDTDMTPAAHPPLRRDTQRKWIAGVCAGIARRYGVSPLVVRAAAVVLSPSGVSIVAYVAAAIFMPDERGHRVADRRDNWTVVAFGALAILAWTTFPDMFDGNALRASLPWLVLLVGWALITRVQPEPTDRVEYGDPEATVYQDVGLDEQDSVMFEAAPTARTSSHRRRHRGSCCRAHRPTRRCRRHNPNIRQGSRP